MSFDSLNLNNSRLGILGGSGLYNIESLENVKEIEVDTPFGNPSDVLKIGNIGDMEVVFLARHGKSHSFPNGLIILSSYHPSPRNVNTKLISNKMMVDLFKKAKKLAKF